MDIRQFVQDHNIIGPLSVRVFEVCSPVSFDSFSAGYRWTPGWNSAYCDMRERHHAPDNFCTCGLYGLTNNFGQIVGWKTLDHMAVVITEARGKVILHKKGLRAERMRVVASVELAWWEYLGNFMIGVKADGWKWARDYFDVPLISAKYIAPLIAYQMDRYDA